MARLMQRMSMVVLLSITLVGGQAEAKVVSSKLSGKLQSFRGQVRKVLESPKTVNYALLAAGLGAAGLGISGKLGLSEHTLVQMLFPFTGASFLVLGKAVNANLIKRHYAAAKDAGKAYRHGENNGSYQVIKMLSESKPDHEPVEVNDRIDMLLKIFMWVKPPFVVNMSHIEAFIDEKGGFPLTAAREGLTFNSGVFVSYEELFGEGNFTYRTDVRTE